MNSIHTYLLLCSRCDRPVKWHPWLTFLTCRQTSISLGRKGCLCVQGPATRSTSKKGSMPMVYSNSGTWPLPVLGHG